MFSLLARLFIKDYRNFESPEVHRSYGALCSAFAIFLNLVLVVAKLVAAHISNASSIRADAINNLSDAGSSIMLLLAFHFAGMKPQPHRPFGHGRIEYIAGFIVAALILLLGVELAKDAVSRILHPQELLFSWITAGTLMASIAVKCYMGLFMMATAKKTHSSALHATGIDSFSDTIATFAVLLSLLIFRFTPNGLNLDGWFELFVSILILKGGYEAVKEPLLQLLGTMPSPELVSQVEQICRSYPEVIGLHDLVVHDYGPGRLHISVHCEVPGNEDIYKLHEAMDAAMEELDTKLGCISVIHMDPVKVDDPDSIRMASELAAAIHEIGPGVRVHDFRIVGGVTQFNVIFDCVVPFDVEPDEKIAREKVQALVARLWENAKAVVHIDRPYV